MIRLELPLPPSGNRSARMGNGHHYTPAAVKRYRQIVLSERRPGVGTLDGDILMDVKVLPPRAGGIDLDNRLKVLQDALQYAGFYANDRNIVDIHLWRGEIKRPDGGVIVELRPA